MIRMPGPDRARAAHRHAHRQPRHRCHCVEPEHRNRQLPLGRAPVQPSPSRRPEVIASSDRCHHRPEIDRHPNRGHCSSRMPMDQRPPGSADQATEIRSDPLLNYQRSADSQRPVRMAPDLARSATEDAVVRGRGSVMGRPDAADRQRTSAVGARQAGLEIADDRAQQARRKQSWSQRSGPVLTDRWELPECSSGRRRHMTELRSDLVGDSPGAVGGGKPSRRGGVRGGTQGMRAHVRDGCGLSGCLGGRRRGRSGNIARGGACDEATPDLLRDIEFAAGEGPRSGDGIAGTAIPRSFGFEQPQHALCAVRRPPGDDPPVGFAHRLRRPHTLGFSQAPRASARPAAPTSSTSKSRTLVRAAVAPVCAETRARGNRASRPSASIVRRPQSGTSCRIWLDH
jgi:hypothetical protein